MSYQEIHALSGAYAVDALDELERERFKRHLADCVECQVEVESLRATSAVLAETTAVAPPPELRERLMSEIRTVRPLPPQVPAPRSRFRRPWLGLTMVAASVILVLGGAGIVVWQQSQTPDVVSVSDQVLQADDAERYRLELSGAEATLVRSESKGKAVLVTKDMPPAPEGSVYQIWWQDETDSMVSAGLMPQGSDQTVVLDGDATLAKGAGITVEPAGGSSAPTSDPIALFVFTTTS